MGVLQDGTAQTETLLREGDKVNAQSLNAFNRNLRTELKKSKKIYFYDNGIRNTVI